MLFPKGSHFRLIKSHKKVDGIFLTLLVQLIVANNGHKYEVDVSFDELKKEEPLACAKYIRQWVAESKRGRGCRPLNQWASTIINSYSGESLSGNGMITNKRKRKGYCDDRLNDLGNELSICNNNAGDELMLATPNVTKVLQDMSKYSGTDGSLFWLHVGISSNNSMIDKIMSAAIIADNIYRQVMKGSSCLIFQNQIKNVVHPFSSMIKTDYNPLVIDIQTITKSKQLYNKLRVEMEEDVGVKFDAYDTYLRKVNLAKILFLHFTKMCLRSKLVEGTPRNVFLFIRNKSPVVVKMLEGKSTSFLANKTKVFDALSLRNYRLFEGLATEVEEKRGTQKRKPIKKKRKKGLNFHKGSTHPNHKKSDDDINSRKVVAERPKPGSIFKLSSSESICCESQEPKDSDQMSFFMDEHLFGGVSQAINSIANTPVIVIETFTDKDGKTVSGIGRQETNTTPGESYMSSDAYNNKQLTNVTICSTTSSYFYVFSEAEKKPHFVLSQSQALKYQLLLMRYEITNRVWYPRSLDLPIKLLSDHSITNGLRSGNLEESDFYFFSNRTTEFKTFFDPEKIRFNLDYFMLIFDEEEFNGNCNDILKRGFTTHIDLGWSREGASSSTEKSQRSCGETINAMPVIMGAEEHFVNLGNLPDLIMTMTDIHVFDNEMKLMSDNDRDNRFAALLRNKMKANKARFEAYTLVRQKVCSIEDLKTSEFKGTSRHTDGPNDTRIGYRHTCVFSFLCQWNNVS